MAPSLKAHSRYGGLLLGASFMWRGFRMWSSRPRLMWWGLLPGLLAIAIVGAALVAVGLNVSRWGDSLVSSFAEPSSTWGWFFSLVAAVGLFAGSALIAAYSFTALTLFIGQPFFERISHHVDAALGEPTLAVEEHWLRSTARGAAEAARMVLLAAVVGVGLWLLALLPVIGTVTAFVLGALFGGWVLALELTAHSLSRRGVVSLRERRALLGQHRPVAVGFGGAVFLMFLVPFGAVVVMPAAVVGATLLTRHTLGETNALPEATQGSPQVTDAQGSP